MGPSILIATARIVAIRTAKGAAQSPGDARLSDVDPDLDREVSLASRITIRIMHELMKRHQSMFRGKMEPVGDGIHEEDSPR
jgi:hypothetical protein